MLTLSNNILNLKLIKEHHMRLWLALRNILFMLQKRCQCFESI